MDLAEFLLARIAEDEAVAQAASPGPWHVDSESATVLAVDDIEVCDGFALSGPQLRATTGHIARHDPARVLAECQSKRRIISACTGESVYEDRLVDFVPLQGESFSDILRALALPYADHPDYRQEWRP